MFAVPARYSGSPGAATTPGRADRSHERDVAGSGWPRRSSKSSKSHAAPAACPGLTAELRFGRGVPIGHNTVRSIMVELGLKGIPNRRPPKGARVARVTSLDLVRRNFHRPAPNQLWLTDITEHPTREGKIYCCAVLDVFSRRVVGWSIESTQTTTLVMNALGMATAKRHPAGELVIHSDRGCKFTSWAFSRKVKEAGLAPSMGSVGSAYDNAMMESF